MANKLFLGAKALIDLSGYYTKAETDAAIKNVDVSDQLGNYVLKDGDKVLSENDFTDALKKKLDGLSNYDDTDVRSAISAVQSTLSTLTGDGKAATAAIDTFKEIEAFLAAYTNQDSLTKLLSDLKTEIETWVGAQGYSKTAFDSTSYYTKAEVDEKTKDGVKGDGTVAKVVALTTAQYADLATKDAKTLYVISD